MNYDLTVSIVTYNTEKEILLKILFLSFLTIFNEKQIYWELERLSIFIPLTGFEINYMNTIRLGEVFKPVNLAAQNNVFLLRKPIESANNDLVYTHPRTGLIRPKASELPLADIQPDPWLGGECEEKSG